MTSRYERSKDLGPTDAHTAASFATANGGFVTRINRSSAVTGWKAGVIRWNLLGRRQV